MPNKYVDFVSDKDFLSCVKHVCDGYPADGSKIDFDKLNENTIDPIKQVFDIVAGGLSYDVWIQNENIRQNDKTINNRIGEFHQKLLGKVKGWTDLGVGDDSKVDLRKNDGSIFIELKNKYNTMNSDATDKCRDKLERAVRSNPRSKAYWAFIISQDGTSGEVTWKKKDREENASIRKAWGKKVYEIVTGDPDALEKVWKALPIAIVDLLKKKRTLSKDETKILRDFFVAAFQ